MSGGKTRAGFLGTGAAAVGGAALARSWRADTAAAAAAIKIEDGTVTEGAFDARYYGDSFYFELDGKPAGRIDAVTGGVPEAEVVTEKLGSDLIAKKHIGNVKYEEISFKCGTGMSKGFYNWIKDSFDGKEPRKTGAIVAFDKSGMITGSGQFTNALLTEITIPALDGASKDAAKMTVKFSPERTSFVPRTGKAPALGGGTPNVQTGNFKLEIDGLRTQDVTNVAAFAVKYTLFLPDGTPVAASKLGFPNLAFTLSGVGQDWLDYYESFLIKGDNSDSSEKAGTLRLLDSKSTEMFALGFKHLGVFKGTADASENNADKIRRVKFEMYVEQVTFDFSPAATFG